jgi:hypothetical protein
MAQERRPSPSRTNVHTQPFAFRAPQEQEDDESVKISNTTGDRSGALYAFDHATGIVILPALSVFCEGKPPLLLLATGPCPPPGSSPAFLCAARLQNPQFLFDTNKPFPPNTNFSTCRKKALPFFYSIQMNSYKSLLAYHYLPVFASVAPAPNPALPALTYPGLLPD